MHRHLNRAICILWEQQTLLYQLLPGTDDAGDIVGMRPVALRECRPCVPLLLALGWRRGFDCQIQDHIPRVFTSDDRRGPPGVGNKPPPLYSA
jgi:hypothetical protein